METVLKLAGICLVASVFALLLKKDSPELSILIVLGTCIVILLSLVQAMEKISSFLQEVYTWGSLPQELFAPLFKTLGIALISRTGAELCRDAEQKAVAALLESVGAFTAILAAVPLFERVWELLKELL